MTDSASSPVAVEGIDRPTVTITWDDGHVSPYTAAGLRRLCACAFCVDELTGKPLLDPAEVPDTLLCKHIGVVGRYALAFGFADGHQSGIYTFRKLREHCPCRGCSAGQGV